MIGAATPAAEAVAAALRARGYSDRALAEMSEQGRQRALYQLVARRFRRARPAARAAMPAAPLTAAPAAAVDADDPALARYRIITVLEAGGRADGSAASIARDVAERHGLTMRDLRSAGRQKDLVLVRHAAMYEVARLTLLSLPQIGRLFGGRDHTTVIAGIRKHALRNGLRLPRGMIFGKLTKGQSDHG